MKKSDWPSKGAVTPNRRSKKKLSDSNRKAVTSMEPKKDIPTPYKNATHAGREQRIKRKVKTLRARNRKDAPKMMRKTIRRLK
jgi:hypothetical protein